MSETNERRTGKAVRTARKAVKAAKVAAAELATRPPAAKAPASQEAGRVAGAPKGKAKPAPKPRSAAPLVLHLGANTNPERARDLGFTGVGIAPYGAPERAVRDTPQRVAVEAVWEAAEGGLDVFVDLPWRLHAPSSPLLTEQPGWFGEAPDGRAVADPRRGDGRGAQAVITDRPDLHDGVARWIAGRVAALAKAGARGVRLGGLHHAPPAFWRAVVSVIREAAPKTVIIGDGLGGAFGATLAAQEAGFDYLMDSAAWWDGEADWFLDQREALTTPTIGGPQAPEGDDLAGRTGGEPAARATARTARAMLTSTALLVPETLLDRAGEGYAEALPDLLSWRAAQGWLDKRGPLLRAHRGLVRLDADPRRARSGAALTADAEGPALAAAGGHMQTKDRLSAGDASLLDLERRDTSRDKPSGKQASRARMDALSAERVAIEDVYPVIDGGRFPAKRIVGDTLAVGADVFSDGHDEVAADLLLLEPGEKKPRRVRMTAGVNDRWGGEVTLTGMGRARFAVEAWRDDYASWVHEVTKKRGAGVDVSVEAIEGEAIVRRSLRVAQDVKLSKDEAALAKRARQEIERAAGDTPALIAALTSPALAELIRDHGERPFAVRTQEYEVVVDRRQARFSAWYEMFPRSQSGSMDRHGTFDDVIGKLPYVQDLGFDVLYFPPIHPIGRTNRKGKNNSLKAEPGDVGSPYAIGSDDGGYTEIHPELGTLDDFARLVDEAAKHGLEIALDIALNCSPDHPWVREHPEWFEHRPDGTIKFAENPPKKYEDIVNLSYYEEAIPGLWVAIRDVLTTWCERGVKVFRIDNPHTKPYPFWEWVIAEVKASHPDALFLSEAFTRPKVMARLAKLGFTQSYTYYTWRNTKHELEAYVRELTSTELREVMNPNFFMNTPDINPVPLQTNNRAAHVARMVLASTLSASWGLYNGIEIVESTVLPGKEEYLDSEKYQIRVWDMDRPGHIKDDIRLMNRLRARHPAMQEHCTVAFLQAWNDQVTWYAKRTPDRSDYLLFAVTFDYEREQRASCELPLWEFGLPDDASIDARDLVSGHDFTWHGKHQDITLGPDRPYAVFQLFGPVRDDAEPLYADPRANT